jgi:hypothetical protein
MASVSQLSFFIQDAWKKAVASAAPSAGGKMKHVAASAQKVTEKTTPRRVNGRSEPEKYKRQRHPEAEAGKGQEDGGRSKQAEAQRRILHRIQNVGVGNKLRHPGATVQGKHVHQTEMADAAGDAGHCSGAK